MHVSSSAGGLRSVPIAADPASGLDLTVDDVDMLQEF